MLPRAIWHRFSQAVSGMFHRHHRDTTEILPPHPAAKVPARAPDPVAPTPVGRPLDRQLAADPEQHYLLYIPRFAPAEPRLLVTVHGASGNAMSLVRQFTEFAERYGVVIVAPVFSKARHPQYWQLVSEEAEARADLTLQQILREVSERAGVQCGLLYLFGYDAGGQFAHRYAMAHPLQVAGVAIASADWYTFPNPTKAFPLGIGPSAGLPEVSFDPAGFLRIPTYVFVGDRDTETDEDTGEPPGVERLQGRNRIERARAWLEAMQAAAAGYGLTTPFEFVLIPRTGHSFVAGVKWGGLGERLFGTLFGAERRH